MPRRGRTPAKTLDFRPSIPREDDAVREYVNEFNALGPAATYAYVRKAGQRVRRKRFQVLRKWLHIIRNQYKWFLCSDLGHPGLDYSPEQHLKKTIPSEGRRVAAAIPGRVNDFETTCFSIYCSDSTADERDRAIVSDGR